MDRDGVVTELEAAPESPRTSALKSGRSASIELITRAEPRRRWSVEQKQSIAAESLAPSASPTEVARRHGISSGMLYTWRKALLVAQPASVEAMHRWLSEQLERVSGRSGLAEAIRYVLRHWQGLILFLDDGRLELDTNTVERAIRPVTLGRKNALFAGADSGAAHWAIVATLIQTAKLAGLVDQCARTHRLRPHQPA